MHNHADLNGHSVTHSHPWLPGNSHSHSQQHSASIAEINDALLTMDLSRTVTVEAPMMSFVLIESGFRAYESDCESKIAVGRAPPVL